MIILYNFLRQKNKGTKIAFFLLLNDRMEKKKGCELWFFTFSRVYMRLLPPLLCRL